MNTIEERRQKRNEYLQKYREEHKEELRQKAKEYYAENKDIIEKSREKNKEKKTTNQKEIFVCECGVEHTRNGKAKHLGTAKHLNNLKKSADEADMKKQLEIDEKIKQEKFKLYDEMMKKKNNNKMIVGSLFD